MTMTLYSYFRSSSSYRVRIALALKGVAFDIAPVNLVKDGGQQFSPEYQKLNPQSLVPCLVHEGQVLAQSMAIMEYLDDVHPEPALVFGAPKDKAYIRRLSQLVACEVHPLNNVRVLKYLQGTMNADEGARNAWYAHWSLTGMRAFERILKDSGRAGDFCLGDRVSMADLCLVPQLYNMRRYNVPLDELPLCRRIEAHCVRLPAFQKAAPEAQADAPADLPPIHGPDAPFLKAA